MNVTARSMVPARWSEDRTKSAARRAVPESTENQWSRSSGFEDLANVTGSVEPASRAATAIAQAHDRAAVSTTGAWAQSLSPRVAPNSAARTAPRSGRAGINQRSAPKSDILALLPDRLDPGRRQARERLP